MRLSERTIKLIFEFLQFFDFAGMVFRVEMEMVDFGQLLSQGLKDGQVDTVC